MYNNYTFYLKCILVNSNYSFISNSSQFLKNDNIYIDSKSLYYLNIHLRFSSLFYTLQLVDMFPYELLTLSSTGVDRRLKQNNNKSVTTLLVYNYHLINTQSRFFIFTQSNTNVSSKSSVAFKKNYLFSITELFYASNWLERECAELHGLFFLGKKDLRNLMLQYGDNSSPFQKSFPTIGLKEMYYNPIKDTIIQNPVSLQI